MTMSKRFRWLPQARWKRWVLFIGAAGFLVFLSLATLALTLFLLWRNPKVQAWVMVTVLRHQARQPAEVPASPRLSNTEARFQLTNALTLRTAADLFQPTNVWDVQLSITTNQWTQKKPNEEPPKRHFFQ